MEIRDNRDAALYWLGWVKEPSLWGGLNFATLKETWIFQGKLREYVNHW